MRVPEGSLGLMMVPEGSSGLICLPYNSLGFLFSSSNQSWWKREAPLGLRKNRRATMEVGRKRRKRKRFERPLALSKN